MYENGWIKLHRKFLHWEWHDTPNTAYLFIILLMLANFEEKKWKGIRINKGEMITSVKKLCKIAGLTTRQVRTALKNLKTTNNITCKTTNRHTKITICNYSQYQHIIVSDDKLNDKQPDKQATNKRQTNDKQTTTTKEYKERKKERKKEIYTVDFENLWSFYPTRLGGNSKPAAYRNYKKCLKDGHTHDELLASVVAYQTYCTTKNMTNSEYIYKASNFFGRDQHFLTNWGDKEYEIRKRNNTKQTSNESSVIKEKLAANLRKLRASAEDNNDSF